MKILTSSQKEIINKLLKIEHNNYASMLKLINYQDMNKSFHVEFQY